MKNIYVNMNKGASTNSFVYFGKRENLNNNEIKIMALKSNLDDDTGSYSDNLKALNYAIDNRIQINLKINLRETYREIRKITKDQFKKIQNIVYEKNDKIITFQDYYE